MLRRFLTFAFLLSLPLFAEMGTTLALIKPDAVEANHIGAIISLFEKSDLKVSALKMQKWKKEDAERFYAIHKNRPFYNDLVAYMTSGPTVAIALKGDDPVVKARAIIGATNPKEAKDGTIRRLFGQSITKNAIHGSDSLENAKTELGFFFKESDYVR